MKRYSMWLSKVSTGWVTIVGLVIFMAFTATVLPAQSEKAQAASNGAESPDTSFFYTPADIYESAEAFGESGRQAYIRARWTFDVVWPIVYTVFLVTSIGWVFSKAFPAESKLQFANLVPVLGMFFDYLENTAATIVMTRFPASSPAAAFLATVFTPVKWVFVNGSFVVLLVGIAVLIWKRITKKKH